MAITGSAMGGGGSGSYAGAITGAISAYQESEKAQQEARLSRRIERFKAGIARNQATEVMQQEQYAAQLRQRDASIATLNSQIALEGAVRREGDVRRAGGRFISSQRARVGASGVAVDEGSSFWSQMESSRLVEYDAQVQGFGLRMESFGKAEDARMLTHEGTIHQARADYMREHGIAAAGELHSVMEEYYERWEDYQGSTQVGQVVLGAAAGFFGTSYSAPKQNQRQDANQGPQTSVADLFKNEPYSYDRQAFETQREGERDRSPYKSDERQGWGGGGADESFVITGGGIRPGAGEGAYF